MKKNTIFFFVVALAISFNGLKAQENIDLSSAKDEELDVLSGARNSQNEDFEGFISYAEYGKNLYENPRGIGCNKCHGAQGQGNIIANYTHKGIDKTLNAPNIKTLSYEYFITVLQNPKKSTVMPKYYLTQKEIEAIYYYIKEQNDIK